MSSAAVSPRLIELRIHDWPEAPVPRSPEIWRNVVSGAVYETSASSVPRAETATVRFGMNDPSVRWLNRR